MKKVDNWTATYEDFLACSDRFTEELDRFHEQIKDNDSMHGLANDKIATTIAGAKNSLDASSKNLENLVEMHKATINRLVFILKQNSKNFWGVILAFLIVAGLAMFSASYFAIGRESLLEVDTRKKAALFEVMWSNATPREKVTIKRILSRTSAEY